MGTREQEDMEEGSSYLCESVAHSEIGILGSAPPTQLLVAPLPHLLVRLQLRARPSKKMTHNTTALIVHAAEYALNKSGVCSTQLLRNRLHFVLNGAA
jgi:hypothetical protein